MAGGPDLTETSDPNLITVAWPMHRHGKLTGLPADVRPLQARQLVPQVKGELGAGDRLCLMKQL